MAANVMNDSKLPDCHTNNNDNNNVNNNNNDNSN